MKGGKLVFTACDWWTPLMTGFETVMMEGVASIEKNWRSTNTATSG